LQLRNYGYYCKRNNFETWLDCSYFSLLYFLVAGSKKYIYSTLTFLAHLDWLKQQDHLAFHLLKGDNQFYTEDECEAAFSVLARCTVNLPVQGEYPLLRQYWKDMPAVFHARRSVRSAMSLEKDLQVVQGLHFPDKAVVDTMEVAFHTLLKACTAKTGTRSDIRVLPPFAPTVQSMQTAGPKLQSFASMDLSPFLDLDIIVNRLSHAVDMNIKLLQPLEYMELVKELVPVFYPVKVLAASKKTSPVDIIGYGWQFGDRVTVKKYGWGDRWWRVTGVEQEDAQGRWSEIWIVDERSVSSDIDTCDPAEFYHGAEELLERLTERDSVVAVKRGGEIIDVDSVCL